ncbi:hypothetical protein [Streptomyces swartbergensis]|nr:hypothetical protein [Streptomyces swartbergensis]
MATDPTAVMAGNASLLENQASAVFLSVAGRTISVASSAAA